MTIRSSAASWHSILFFLASSLALNALPCSYSSKATSFNENFSFQLAFSKMTSIMKSSKDEEEMADDGGSGATTAGNGDPTTPGAQQRRFRPRLMLVLICSFNEQTH
jgi:hypothetical protein